jgi:exosortase/archaeosortase family protein
MLLGKSVHTLSTLPIAVRHFLLRSLLLFIVWQTCYLLWLAPLRIIDRPLTLATGHFGARLLQSCIPNTRIICKESMPLITKDYYQQGAIHLWAGARRLVGLADACNALGLYMLYAGFLIAYPATKKRMYTFWFLGWLSIFFLNALRVMALAWIQYHWPEMSIYAHHWLFNTVVYLLIFYQWWRYCHE